MQQTAHRFISAPPSSIGFGESKMFFRLVHIQFLCLLLSIVVILLYAKNAINYPYSTVILFHEINASVFQPFIHYGILSHEIEPAGSQPPAPMKRHTWNSPVTVRKPSIRHRLVESQAAICRLLFPFENSSCSVFLSASGMAAHRAS